MQMVTLMGTENGKAMRLYNTGISPHIGMFRTVDSMCTKNSIICF